VPGFNQLLNTWFQEELETLREEGLFVNRVKQLIVVNIDSLFYNQIGLSKGMQLHEVINFYTKRIVGNTTMDNKLNFRSEYDPFSHHMIDIITINGFGEVPPIVETVAPSLFKDEYVEESKEA